MMITYPIDFFTETQAECGMEKEWTTRSSSLATQISIPSEFEGPGGNLSPEDLFNQALSNCFVATFKVFAEKSKLTFSDLKTEAKLVVDLNERRRPVMKDFFLKVEIHGASDKEKAVLLAKKAAENGFILNSVKTACHFDFQAI